MIYAKIYLEDDENIIFESSTIDDGIHCCPAGKYKTYFGTIKERDKTTISPAQSIAISSDALDKLKSIFVANNPNLTSQKLFGDFEFYKSNMSGVSNFSFKPDENQIRKKLNINQKFTICTRNGLDLSILDDMTISNNELLKNLDLSQPANNSAVELSKPSAQPYQD